MSLLDRVPLNTKKAFVMAKTPDGCEVYLPVDTTDHTSQEYLRDQFRAELNTIYVPPPLQLA